MDPAYFVKFPYLLAFSLRLVASPSLNCLHILMDQKNMRYWWAELD